ncbi:MAG TPA: NUDIX hydrolase N-terminal domain-containing protein [Chloroflexota bacterium]|nr:NUDIX hydrolase N-terminal domain-containing protein [Chloroflexota bacterium]
MDPEWLRWVKRLQAIAQDGLTYTRDDYDAGRYEQLQEVAAEILAAHSTGDLGETRELLSLEAGPATPKVDVRAAVFRDGGEVLLIKEPDDGGWSLPGGWADVGESASEAAVREVREEVGLAVTLGPLIGLYSAAGETVVLAVYAAAEAAGEAEAGDDLVEVGWFPPDGLPELVFPHDRRIVTDWRIASRAGVRR